MLSGTLSRYRPGIVNVQIDTGIETTVAGYSLGGLSTCHDYYQPCTGFVLTVVRAEARRIHSCSDF